MDFTPTDVLVRWLISLTVDGLRYFLVAGAAFAIFWIWGRERFAGRRVLGRSPLGATMLHDLRHSTATILVFSVIGVGVYFSGRAGVLRRYEDPLEYGRLWLIVSVPALIVLQDTYFYWTHRAMHLPRVYGLFHRAHHQARTPSPWTAYAFAVPEAVVHAAFVPLAWLVLPLHELAVFVFLIFMIARNVQGHLSIELNHSGFTRHRLWGVLTTTTHHCLHHEHAGFDFGLYFTFWDRVMGTEHPLYHHVFERAAAGAEPSAAEPSTAESSTQDQARPMMHRAERPTAPRRRSGVLGLRV